VSRVPSEAKRLPVELESGLLGALKRLATDPAARGLEDDAAVLPWPLGLELVATHDMLAEGVHFTPACPPADIGWKLVAVNFSDLAAMGARPVAVLFGLAAGPGRDARWGEEVATGLAQALARFGGVLLGGDTVRTGDASLLSLTALGSVPPGAARPRSGACAGDDLWVSGTIGDAGLGLEIANGTRRHEPHLLKRYRRPTPRVKLGLLLRGLATAAIDVSDGLLLDAGRLAAASGLRAEVCSASIPLSVSARAAGVAPALLAAMGDDYELLFAARPESRARVAQAATVAGVTVTRIGGLVAGEGVLLDGRVPERLGFRHR
jgi:thiamine-monophosphate kinase